MIQGIGAAGMGVRLATLVVVVAALWVVVWLARRFVEARRQQALRAAPTLDDAALLRSVGIAASSALTHAVEDGAQPPTTRKAHILAFSSEDCRPCHTLQKPALERLLTQRPGALTVAYIDAPSSPELTQRYQVLTVPTTVVLDDAGKPHAINYGFANAEKLLAQVDAVRGA